MDIDFYLLYVSVPYGELFGWEVKLPGAVILSSHETKQNKPNQTKKTNKTKTTPCSLSNELIFVW